MNPASLFQSSMSVVIPNNMAIDIPESEESTIVAPFHGNEESLLEATNSAFTKVTELINYTWMKQSNVNLVAVHRSKPLVAYVINVSYHKHFVTGKTAAYNPTIPEQMVRLINYNNQSRALCKMCAVDVVVDIAFSFDEVQEQRHKRNLICTIDRAGYINLFSFTEVDVLLSSESKPQMTLNRFMTIQPPVVIDSDSDASFIKLAWCPYVPASDGEEPNINPSTRLAITIGRNLEIITLNDFHVNPQTSVEVPRTHFKKDLGEYYSLPTVHDKEIVAVAVSNDGTLVCTTGVDNVVKFFKEELESNVFSFQKMREWIPCLESGESIANTSFLDDYNFLLDHPDQPFWGYMFIGTTGGVMYVYDMQQKDWKCTQKIRISLQNNEPTTPDTSFSYHVDQASKVILATTGSTVFVFLLEYREETGDEDSILRTPRVNQVARFQLYNPVISFTVKVPNEREIDIFWITLKSLERCTIDVSKLSDCKVTHQSNVDHSLTSQVKKVNTVTPSPASKQSVHTPVPASVLAAQEKVSQLTNELNKLKRKSDASIKGPLISPAAQVTPDKRVSTQNLLQQMMFSQTSGMTCNALSPNIPSAVDSNNFTMHPLLSSLPSPSLNDTAKVMLLENKMHQMQADLVSNLTKTQHLISSSFKGLQSEIGDLKAHVSQPSVTQVKESPEERNKLVEKTVNRVVSKAMEQLNISVSRGLKDFFDQVDVGIGDLQTTVKTSVDDIRAGMEENNRRLDHVRTQLEIFQKQLEKNEAEQQILMYRFQQLAAGMQ